MNRCRERQSSTHQPVNYECFLEWLGFYCALFVSVNRRCCCCWHRASWRSALWRSTGNSMRRWELLTQPILGGRGFTLLWWTSSTNKFEKGSQNRTDKKGWKKLSLQWIQCARAHHHSERWQEGWTSAICSSGRIKLIFILPVELWYSVQRILIPWSEKIGI